MIDKYTIIVAGGTGTRMQSQVPKQFMLIHEKPVLWYSIRAFLDADDSMKIIVVLPEAYMQEGMDIIAQFPEPLRFSVMNGGITRFHSVKNGLEDVTTESIVLVHDAVRCLVTPELIQRCYQGALEKGNAIPAIEPIDTLRMITASGSHPVDRSHFRIIQTPQAFKSSILIKAFEQDYDPSFTDEASVVEKSGMAIHLVEGSATNFKITRQQDLIAAAAILQPRDHQSE